LILNIPLLLIPQMEKSNGLVVENNRDALVIRFARPEIRSPLSVHVLDELDRIIDATVNDKAIVSVVFMGTDDVFASGADLREIAEVSADGAREFALRGQNLMNKIAALKQRTVAAISGYCFGGALDLALACDTRIASPDATFSHPGTSLGIITGWGGTQRLPRLVGQANALEMFFTAKRVDAAEALRIGLVDEIVDDLLRRAIE
jgi:enoyl-CoA hydratase